MENKITPEQAAEFYILSNRFLFFISHLPMLGFIQRFISWRIKRRYERYVKNHNSLINF